MTSEELATFIERRRRFVEAIGDGLAVVPAAPETLRNNDVSHPFRQHSDFYFLTGFDEPDAVAVFNPARARGFPAPTRIEDPGPLVHELRLRRSPAELARQRRACQISRDAHIEAMRYARPGLHEYQVQAAVEFVFRSQGSPRDAYPSII